LPDRANDAGSTQRQEISRALKPPLKAVQSEPAENTVGFHPISKIHFAD